MKKKFYLIAAIISEIIYLLIIIPKLFDKYIPFNGPSINKFLVYKGYINYLNSKHLLFEFMCISLLWATIFTISTLGLLYILNKITIKLLN